MDSVGEGEGGKIWENGIETCKISCMKRVASPGSMHDTGCLGLVHWDDPEGWYGEGGGFRVGSITMNKACGGDGIPAELFQVLKDDAVKVLQSICQQIWKTQQWPQDWKVFIPIPKKGNAKECSNSHTIVLISHTSKVMLKILQARLL